MAPEIRWAVLRAALVNKTAPRGTWGLLAYLFAVDPGHLQSAGLAEALGVSKGTLRGLLRALEVSGFIRVKRGSHGHTVELLMPPGGVQTVKSGHPDTVFSEQVDMHVIVKREQSQAPDSQTRAITEPVIVKREQSPPPVIVKREQSQSPDSQTKAIMSSEFLRGMLGALETGSKPENTDPVCPDNSEIKPP